MAGIIKPEFPEEIVFITARTMLSRLWFQLSPGFNNFFQAALARYQEMYNVEIYSFVLMANHYHLQCRFPEGNRAAFERDFNSILARALKYYVQSFLGGKLWGRPYRFQILPLPADVKRYFLYTVLNPVTSGITQDPLAEGRPNALRIIKNGGSETFRWFNRSAYNNAKRKNPNVRKDRYYSMHTLRISRLPGYESLNNHEYIQEIQTLVRARQKEIITERKSSGRGFLGIKKLKKQQPGSLPRNTKTSTRKSYNPLILSECLETFKRYLSDYMAIVDAYKLASRKFLAGDEAVEFPRLCYMPSRLVLVDSRLEV